MSTPASAKTIPVTVFTGFLGAGKTTVILSLLQRIPKGYNNEFGDVEVDSALVRESNVQVQEMLNGCMCCVLVGQMKNALLELKEKYNPDRVIIETSGSAFPAPIAWQIREMAGDGFTLDAILTVVDCVNFTGYEDTSYTAKMQAKYTDMILFTKHTLVDEYQLDKVIDHVNELNTDTPKLRVDPDQGLSPDVAFGLDTTLFQRQTNGHTGHARKCSAEDIAHLRDHHEREVDIVQLTRARGASADGRPLSRSSLLAFLEALPKDEVYRVKGFVRLRDDETEEEKREADQDWSDAMWIVNCAFGRCTLTPLTQENDRFADDTVRITVMGQDLRMLVPRLAAGFGLPNDEAHLKTYWR
ncbi:CobW/HypB/UreG, nucleotide-binding domain-containing protein [Thamnocephalis sphaerospora]|uniref:CobW/HypB/UreG, nucleotide-binding domain-containing protein n=1 Tax=Thamnocephalis sphaerospora TaxID=78915 RepID=A0A4P9XTT6_9FUNG|nr:CobW/HypB/UreG, nucleotide-binding domain-containing protein [Thamnocephalis sphaerospora]|eukprot:RKP09598.1 CobW/HypB/UreG, nucleotide-binding domain-containing protein [Thamnocephalis sphaerospora]